MSHYNEIIEPAQISSRLQKCGVAGAGGAGFPSYAKWQNLEEIDNFLVNLEEGEPVFYGDRWLFTTNIDLIEKGLNFLAENVFSSVVIGTKKQYREKWFKEFEKEINPSVITPEDLPLDTDKNSGVFLAYTPNRYEISQEPALLWTVANVQLDDRLPMEFGWIVQNAETTFNIIKALRDKQPVVSKQVAVFGPEIEHRYYEVPVGTPAVELLEDMGINPGRLGDELILLDGGPGWCCVAPCSPREFGVTKRTNGLLIVEKDFPENYRDPKNPSRIDALQKFEWKKQDLQQQPEIFNPDEVIIPTISNPDLADVVNRSIPTVQPGQTIQKNDVIARASEEGISNFQHASIPGTVKKVSKNRITINRRG